MSRYKYTKLKNLSPLHGFLIYTPDDRTLKDLHPQFIVRELNRLNERIKRLEEAGDRMTTWLRRNAREGSKELSALRQWNAAKEAKP